MAKTSKDSDYREYRFLCHSIALSKHKENLSVTDKLELQELINVKNWWETIYPDFPELWKNTEVNKSIFSIFIKRLKRIGVDIELIGNYPWVYLDRVNGIPVTTKYWSDHSFCIGFIAIRKEDSDKFTDIGIIYEEIRKILKCSRK